MPKPKKANAIIPARKEEDGKAKKAQRALHALCAYFVKMCYQPKQ